MIIKFIDYVKRVCDRSVPEFLLRNVLECVTKCKESYLLAAFSQVGDLLCRLDPHEILRMGQQLQKFLDICKRNNCWLQIARLFLSWAMSFRYFPSGILRVLTPRDENASMLFKMLAIEVYGSAEPIRLVNDEWKYFLGVIGITLMMECYHSGVPNKEDPRNVHVGNAWEVLDTLQKYGVDLFNVAGELGWNSSSSVLRILMPYKVIFAAADILLLLERPKDCFLLFKNYSEKLCGVPAVLDPLLKSSIRERHIALFIKVVELLQHSDPFGLSAFKDLMSTVEQEGFLRDLNGLADVTFKAINAIYNDHLVTSMNKSLDNTVFELYQYTQGPCDTWLHLNPQVLRGLVVTFAKGHRMDLARPLFVLGCSRSIYEVERPKPKRLPFRLTISSDMTTPEIQFTIERFLRKMLPVLAKEKPVHTKFEDWFSLKIMFKEIPFIPSKITCLIVNPVPNTLKRTCGVLGLIYSDFTYTEYEDYILLSHEHVYSYYNKNYRELQGAEAFSVAQSRPPAVGSDLDSAANFSSSRTPGRHPGSFGERPKDRQPGSFGEPLPNRRPGTHEEPLPDRHPGLCGEPLLDYTQVYNPNDQFGPANPHLTEEVSSTTSDNALKRTANFGDPENPAKRRISFSSSERSSTHTPEDRPLLDRRGDEPFLDRHTGAICEPLTSGSFSKSRPLLPLPRSYSGGFNHSEPGGSFAEPFPGRFPGSYVEPLLDRRTGSHGEPLPDRRSGSGGEPLPRHPGSFGDSLAHPGSFGESLSRPGSFGDPLSRTSSSGEPLSRTGSYSEPLSRTGSYSEPLSRPSSIGEPLSRASSSGEPFPDRRSGSGGEPLPHPGSFVEPLPRSGSFREPVRRPGSYGEPIPDLRSGSVGEHGKDSRNDPLECRGGMSQLSNFRCRKVSPRQNTPQIATSPAISPRSPQKTFLVQSQDHFRHQSPRKTLSAQSQDHFSHQSPRKTLSAQSQDNFSPQSPRKTISAQSQDNFSCQSPRKTISAQSQDHFSRQSPQKTILAQDHCSRQSPSKALPVQSRSKTSPFQPYSKAIQSPNQNNSSIVSLKGSSSMQSNKETSQSSKQRASRNISPGRSICKDTTSALDNDFINQYKNKSSLLISPPMNGLGNAGRWISGESKPLVNNVGTLNVPSERGRKFENFKIKPSRSGHSQLPKPLQSNIVKTKKSETVIKTQRAISKNTSTDKDSNLTARQPAIPVQHASPSSSPELTSAFQPLPKPKSKRLLLNKKADPPKLPPYRIPTPCKQARVIRPVTPVIKSGGDRSKTPLSIQMNTPRTAQNLRRPIPTRTPGSRGGIFDRVGNTFKAPTTYENFTLSFQGKSHGRVINATSNDSVPQAVYEKASLFIKSRVLLSIDTNDEDRDSKASTRATALTNTFFENNSIRQINSKLFLELNKFIKPLIKPIQS